MKSFLALVLMATLGVFIIGCERREGYDREQDRNDDDADQGRQDDGRDDARSVETKTSATPAQHQDGGGTTAEKTTETTTETTE